MLRYDHWHIEPSSRCALKCPRCPRNEVPETLLNHQLALSFFVNQLGEDTIKKIKKITFCGNDGDPIYCTEFLEICQWIKQVNPTIKLVIISNGSHKPPGWWKALAEILNNNDEVQWSLDGWSQDSNVKYRVNSDWDSIVQGFTTFFKYNNSTYRTWASIGFRFNQDYIAYQTLLAQEYGFDLYQLTKSTKFNSKYPAAYPAKDLLEPTDKSLIPDGHRFERINNSLTSKIRPGDALIPVFLSRAEELDKHSSYSGICLIGSKGVFLNSRGEFYPCCWVANRYDHNHSWNMLGSTQFNLYKRKFEEIINDTFWQTDFLKFDNLECTSKCTKEKLQDIHHTTEW